MLLLANARIHTGEEPEFRGSILIDQGKIARIFHDDDSAGNPSQNCFSRLDKETDEIEIVDLHGNHLLPGLIDIHLHGSYGADFIRDPQHSVNIVSTGLPSEGTTSFLASLTVISHEDLCGLLQEYSAVTSPENGARFLGVHSEGPFLSHDYKALMDPQYLRDASQKEFDEMKQAAGGTLKVMTIAPERDGTIDLIENESEVTMMIGHSAASSAQALQALEAGAAGFTHLYNAMSQHNHRNPGCVTAALMDESCYCELIVDGFHIHPDVIRATWKILGPERLVLITDAMPGKGMPDGEYIFSNLNCIKSGNTVQVADTGRIAGSAITLLDAIKNMKAFCNASLDDLVCMACVNPSRLAGASDHKGSLAAGKDADLIVLDEKLNLLSTWILGRQVWQKSGSES